MTQLTLHLREELAERLSGIAFAERKTVEQVAVENLCSILKPIAIEEPPHRAAEMQWLADHRDEYAGLWVALEGNRLIASDADARIVFAAAKTAGITRPFVLHLELLDSLPFAGW